MPLRKLKFECSECEKTVEKDGIFLQDNGNREGFCNLQCIYSYVGRIVKPVKVTKPKEKKIKLEGPPQPPPGRPG